MQILSKPDIVNWEIVSDFLLGQNLIHYLPFILFRNLKNS